MKTIGERFDEMAEAAGVSKTDKSYYFGRSCCFQIATEQKAIDAIELPQRFRKVLEKRKVELIDKACKWLKINYGHFDGSIEDLVADFRKAMEEDEK